MTDTYDDGTIVCGSAGLEIHVYYFPFGTKRIPYAHIRGIRRVEITGPLSGKWRLWGTSNPRYWANLDRGRPRRKAGFVIDLGRRVSPLITPERPDDFESALRARVDLPQGNAREMKGPFI